MNDAHVTAAERPDTRSATRRTLLALLAGMLGAIPLKSLLSDSSWLIQGWLAMAIVVAPAALLRLRRAPSALDIWPGVILLVPWLTLIYVPHHAFAGIVPTPHTFRDVGHLMDSLHHTTSNEVAPIHSTVAVRLVIAALLGLLAALIDLIAVVGRRGALAGIPLLVVYTVSGAVPRSPVAWFYFGPAAVGYLILLELDAADELRSWGRRVSRPQAAHGRPGLAFSGPRIGIAAIVVALVLPLLVPSHPKNLVANIFHSGGGNGLGGFGAVGTGGSISPFAALKGQLTRGKPVPLMNVHIDQYSAVQPFYVRTNVLDRFNGDGWTVSGHGDTEPADVTSFDTLPVTGVPRTANFQASITISGLGGNAPVFSVPQRVSGLEAGTEWSPQDQVLVGTSVHKGDEIVEQVAQPQPTVAELDATPTVAGPDMSRWLQLPALPTYVTGLVHRITAGATTPYRKAKAIFDWFGDPANGFVYSLKTTQGDSGNELVDFLQNRVGFCQQYAAAMGVMLRAAGVPTRVVLGYMHPTPNALGDFTISTFDAHAWVEAFFAGIGWIPFDPTPTTGLVGGKKTDLAWAQHGAYSNGGVDRPPPLTGSLAAPKNSVSPSRSTGAPSAAASRSSSSTAPILAGVIVLGVILIGLLPAMIRTWRRRARLVAARHGDADALWAELSDTAVDLGYVWSPARSPRQVSAWLATDASDAAPALSALATAVEQGRYAPDPRPQDTNELTRGLVLVTSRLRGRRSGKVRLRARLWPASLGWSRGLGAARGVLRRRH